VPPTATPELITSPLPEPERIEFALADGSPLVGTYYPPRVAPAPGLLLIHQLSVDRSAWEPLIGPLRAEDAPQTYAIFAYDLPEHGESGGAWSPEATLESAALALGLMRSWEGVDPDRIALIGASVGSDAVVDECSEGCVGAVSLSPGGYLGISYADALATLLDEKDPPVMCVASAGDGPSPATCRSGESVGLSDYQVHIYEGTTHGNFLLVEAGLAPPPDAVALILEWLAAHLPL
jgi:pimeloyl-ACP methyl ester carboxylesterase